MPFEVFRRHQRKWLAVLALLAMVAFTLDLSLFRGRGVQGRGNPVVFKAGNKEVHLDEVDSLRIDRLRANQFMAALGAEVPRLGIGDSTFGATTDEAMLDSWVLEQEAIKLGIPATAEMASAWLRKNLGPLLSTERFDRIYRENFENGPLQCTDAQLLESIARQLRIAAVLNLPGGLDTGAARYLVTPFDLYQAFRQQQERVSAKAVAFPVWNYIDRIPDPTAAELQAFFDKYKNQPPDPEGDTPGFLIPRKVQVEYVTVDTARIEDSVRSQIDEAALREHYLLNKSKFPPPPRELPDNLFAGDPEAKLTPRAIEPFLEVKDRVLIDLSESRVTEEISELFGEVREQVMDPFLDRYDKAVEANREARERGQVVTKLPQPVDESGRSLVKQIADKLGLDHEITPLLDREQASYHMPIARASMGGSPFALQNTFPDIIFTARASVYEPFELSDGTGMRFLGWKLADIPERAPNLDEVRDQVVLAWKEIQARVLAQQDAEALAAEARARGGDLSEVAGDRPVLVTSDLAAMTMIPMFDQLSGFGARPTEIPELPRAGEALRDALFSLQPGEVKVEANAPKNTYYVLALNRRTPAELRDLFGLTGSRFGIEQQVVMSATIDRQREWLDQLRDSLGVVPGPGMERSTRNLDRP